MAPDSERSASLLRMTTIRPIASLAELARVESVITVQFPPRRGTSSHGSHVLRRRFAEDRSLMLVAERDGEIVGGALAFRADGAVKIEVIALAPEARRSGIGRDLIERIAGASASRDDARSCRRRSSVIGAHLTRRPVKTCGPRASEEPPQPPLI